MPRPTSSSPRVPQVIAIPRPLRTPPPPNLIRRYGSCNEPAAEREVMTEQDRKVAIITGGSQGIGAGLVAEYRRRGWAVVATSRTIKPSADPAVLTVDGDVSD